MTVSKPSRSAVDGRGTAVVNEPARLPIPEDQRQTWGASSFPRRSGLARHASGGPLAARQLRITDRQSPETRNCRLMSRPAPLLAKGARPMKARHSRHYTRQAISVGIALAGMAWDANWHSNTLVSATGTETTTPTPLTTLPPTPTLSAPLAPSAPPTPPLRLARRRSKHRSHRCTMVRDYRGTTDDRRNALPHKRSDAPWACVSNSDVCLLAPGEMRQKR